MQRLQIYKSSVEVYQSFDNIDKPQQTVSLAIILLPKRRVYHLYIAQLPHYPRYKGKVMDSNFRSHLISSQAVYPYESSLYVI